MSAARTAAIRERSNSHGFVAKLLIRFVIAYQRIVSPYLPGGCRFTPSCSQYAHDALEAYGARQGAWMAVRRICRCHPLGGSGFDPVRKPHG